MDPLTIISLIDAAVRIGGNLGESILTLIAGHKDTPDAQRVKAVEARGRLLASSDSIDAYRDEIRAQLRTAQVQDGNP